MIKLAQIIHPWPRAQFANGFSGRSGRDANPRPPRPSRCARGPRQSLILRLHPPSFPRPPADDHPPRPAGRQPAAVAAITIRAQASASEAAW